MFLQQIGVRLIVSLRGNQINTSPVADEAVADSYRRCFPYVNAFHAVSEAIAKKAEKYGADPNKTIVIRPAVDRALIEESNNDVKVIDRKRIRIFSVGRNHWKKGYRYALDACVQLMQKGIDFEYIVVAGNDCESLLYQRDQLGLNDNVQFINRLPHSKVLKLYKKMDLFLLPSIEEGIANVVLEAMALGCPVLSSNCGGMTEVIENGFNGLLFPITDVVAMVKQIEHFISMPAELVHQIRENARATIQEKHLLDQQIPDMITLYHEIMGK